MMKGMVLSEFGDVSVFERQDLPKPEPDVGELRVRVHATAVNPLDCRVRREGASMGLSTPLVLGYDASGVVDAVGPGVEDFEVGDEVFYTSELFEDGCYAEYNTVSEQIVARKPENLTHAEAAALPVVASTGWAALIERGDLQLGEQVLVHGVGGVGQQVVQIAAAAGAEVFASASPQTTDIAERLGADTVVDYRSGDFVETVDEETDGEGVDLVVDTVGGGLLEQSIEALADQGRMVDIVGEPGDVGPTGKLANATVEFMALMRTKETIAAVRRLALREQIVPVIDSEYPLEEVGAAHQALEEGGITGKIVLQIHE
jgi:NADPH:quinone reductase-like Zn-dependent oxidoreductase